MARNAQPSRAGRIARMVALKSRGLTDPEISTQMKEEGYHYVSPRNISRLINSTEAKQFTQELWNQQLRDITTADPPLRLKYRDRLLDKLIPQPQTQINVQQSQASVEVKHIELSAEDAFGEYGDIFLERWAQLRMERGTQPSLSEDTGEPVAPKDEPKQ